MTIINFIRKTIGNMLVDLGTPLDSWVARRQQLRPTIGG